MVLFSLPARLSLDARFGLTEFRATHARGVVAPGGDDAVAELLVDALLEVRCGWRPPCSDRSFPDPVPSRSFRNPAVNWPAGRIVVAHDIVPDEGDPQAVLSACDAFGEVLGRIRVKANFRLDAASAGA